MISAWLIHERWDSALAIMKPNPEQNHSDDIEQIRNHQKPLSALKLMQWWRRYKNSSRKADFTEFPKELQYKE